MRPIKFRAWDKRHRRFYKPILGRDGRAISAVEGELGSGNDDILSQFTGLLDKNGKEIWEGDVVQQQTDTFGVYWNDEMAAFALTNRHGIPVGAWGEMELIGNIYENPELLTNNL